MSSSSRTREPKGRRTSRKASSGIAAFSETDLLIHQRARLGIVSALAVHGALTFTRLKVMLRATDGNLSVHARKLEEAGLISCAKTFEERVPKTTFRLTAAGRRALASYVGRMKRLLLA